MKWSDIEVKLIPRNARIDADKIENYCDKNLKSILNILTNAELKMENNGKDLQMAIEQLYDFARSRPARTDIIADIAIPHYELIRRFIAFNNYDQLKLATGDPYSLVAEEISDRFAYAVKMVDLRKRIEIEFKAPVESPENIGIENYIKKSCLTTEELTFMGDFSGSYTQVLIKRDKILPAIQHGRFWYIPIIPAVGYLKTRKKYPKFFKSL